MFQRVERGITMPGSALLGAEIDHDGPPDAPVVEDCSPPGSGSTVGRAVTALLVCAPLLGFGILLLFGWNHFISLGDLILAVALYLVTGFGVAAGHMGRV